MRFATFILIFTVTSFMSSYSRFPEDAPESDVIDRAFFRGDVDEEEHVVYMIMYDLEDQGTLDVASVTFSSGSCLWKTKFFWKPVNCLSEPALFLPRSVIDIQLCGSSLFINWVDGLSGTYVEGTASQYLEYDLQSGCFEEF